MAMDFENDKRLIEEFFKNNGNLFFPNDKYSKEYVEKIVLDYCEMLHKRYQQMDQRRYKLFVDAGLPTNLDWLDIENYKKTGHSDYEKITNEMKKATSDTWRCSMDMDYFREEMLNKSNYKDNNLSNCEHLLKDIVLQTKSSQYEDKLSYDEFLNEYDQTKREKCPNCGSTKSPIEKSMLYTNDTIVGIILLLFCFPIGVIYFWVKKGNKQRICPDCGKPYKKT